MTKRNGGGGGPQEAVREDDESQPNKGGRAKQATIPGVEISDIPAVQRAANEWLEADAEVLEKKKVADELKKKVIKAMKTHAIPDYRSGDLIIKVRGSEHCSIKRIRPSTKDDKVH